MYPRNPLTPPPQDTTYTEWLRYIVQSSDPHAEGLDFLIGLWSYAVKFGGLTTRQERSLEPYMQEAREWLALHEPQAPKPEYTGNVVNLAQRRKNKKS